MVTDAGLGDERKCLLIKVFSAPFKEHPEPAKWINKDSGVINSCPDITVENSSNFGAGSVELIKCLSCLPLGYFNINSKLLRVISHFHHKPMFTHVVVSGMSRLLPHESFRTVFQDSLIDIYTSDLTR